MPTGPWEKRQVLMVVKAYPNPEDEYGEACCTAGVDDDDNWIRIWPIPFRDLRPDQKFKKWQWITATVRKSNDPRPESHELQPDTIVLGDVVDTKRAWTKRLAVLAPHYVKSVEELQEMQKNGAQTMGTIRPREVLAFVIEERDDPNWKAVQAAQLNQQGLFTAPKLALERIPYKFSYRFTCDDDKCKTIHKLQILDWEVAEAYRSWRAKYGPDGWEAAMHLKFSQELPGKDLIFIGNYIKYPARFGIVGIVYPPKPAQPDDS